MSSLYFDYNSTTPLWPSVKEAVIQGMHLMGNPSSPHGEGRKAHGVMEQARTNLGQMWGVHPAQIIFTSSGSEANNMILRTFAGQNVLVSSVEHSSVLKADANAVHLPVNAHGLVDCDMLEKILTQQKFALLCVMLANNETGIVQPLEDIVRIAHAHGCRVHTDAVAVLGKMPVEFTQLDVDYMSVSAHKIGGPKGIGAVIAKEGAPLQSLIHGGGQERRRRAGTENIPAILGFAEAMTMMQTCHWTPVIDMRHRIETHLKKWGVKIIGENQNRLPNTIGAIYPRYTTEMLGMKYDLAKVCISAGAACSSGKITQQSHVLSAMGYDTQSALRISLGWNTTSQDVETFCQVTDNILQEKVA